MDSNDVMKQLQANKGALLQLMNSPDGKRLVQLINQQAGSGNLKRAGAAASGGHTAAGAAAKGDTTDISRIIQDLVRTPEGAQVVERINRTMEQ